MAAKEKASYCWQLYEINSGTEYEDGFTSGAGHERAIAAVLPALLEASSRLAPNGSAWAGQLALDCTVAICRASATLRAEVLLHLSEVNLL